MSANEQLDVINSKFPPSPPPVITPHYGKMLLNIPEALGSHLYSYVYLWTANDGSFWMYPTSLAPCNTLSGYKWERSMWNFIELDSSQIYSFF